MYAVAREFDVRVLAARLADVDVEPIKDAEGYYESLTGEVASSGVPTQVWRSR